MSDADMFKAVKQYEQYGKIIPCFECKHFERWENTPGNGYCNYGAGRYTFGGGYCDKAQIKDSNQNENNRNNIRHVENTRMRQANDKQTHTAEKQNRQQQ